MAISKALICAIALAGWAQAQIVVSHKSLSGTGSVVEIKPELKVKNNGTTALDLSKVSIDYLLYEQGIAAGSLVPTCYYATPVACPQVSFDVASIPLKTDGTRSANLRVRILFAQGTLPAGQELDIQWAIHGQGWTHRFVEADDWSYTAGDGQWHEAPLVEFDGSGGTGAQTPMIWGGTSASLPTTGKAGNVRRVVSDDATYVYDGASWKLLVKGIRGATGDKGDRGPTGPAGAPGATGSKGLTGSKGAMGAWGATGAQGPVGDKGLPGQPGLAADLTNQTALLSSLKSEVKAATSARLGDAVSEASIGGGSVFLRPDGTVWLCGSDMGKYLGTSGDVLVPTRIPGLENIVQIATGYSHMLFLKRNGDLLGMGSNAERQLGAGFIDIEKRVPILILNMVKSVFAGGNTTIALLTDNTLYASGGNKYGLTGAGHAERIDIFSQLPHTAIRVSISDENALFLRADGSLFASGLNSSGQLGDGTTVNRLTPVRVQVPGTVTSMVAAGSASVVLQTDGEVYVMGSSLNGAIGTGDPIGVAISTPTKVGSDAISVATNGAATFIVNRRNELWATGENNLGDFGTGSTAGSNRFTRLHGDRKFLSVTCHPASGTFYRMVDGTVLASGMNNGGSLGTGGTVPFEFSLQDVRF